VNETGCAGGNCTMPAYIDCLNPLFTAMPELLALDCHIQLTGNVDLLRSH